MSASSDLIFGTTKEDVMAQSRSLLAIDVYKPFQILDQSEITKAYIDAAHVDHDLLEGEPHGRPLAAMLAERATDSFFAGLLNRDAYLAAIMAELHALKLDIMMQLYTTEQSLQNVHNSQLSSELASMHDKQRNAHWVKDALTGLVQNLKQAFMSFFGGRASPLFETIAQPTEPETKDDKASPPSSWLAGIVKADADLDLEQVSQADAEGSTCDLDELESILADVNELFLQLMVEIYQACERLQNQQGQKLATLLTEINVFEEDQERDREAIVNFLELLRATLEGLQHPELAALD
ncbi:hypothetical protein JCM10908_004773 [Rhodotorula pacifica]|uniref:uncharacterized protein n=1 Tax=Rhodotorula pacifica TaxID=1495444 RepID=UPI0031779A3F